MKYRTLSKECVEYLRRIYPPGTRLQVCYMEYKMAVPPGSMGTVRFVDDQGLIHMHWDCGYGPVIAPGADSFRYLSGPKEKEGDAR